MTRGGITLPLPSFGSRYGQEPWTLSNKTCIISKDQRYRGMVFCNANNTVIPLKQVRAALDRISLDGVREVEVRAKDWRHNHYMTTYRKGRVFSFSRYALYTFRPAADRPGRSPRIAVTAPCGETKIYSLRLLDKMLTQFGV